MAYPLILARFLVALMVAVLLVSALRWLDMPPLYRMVRAHDGLLFYQGHFLLVLVLVLAWFHAFAEQCILWLGAKLRRWATALLMSALLLADGGMHLLNIPHMEGWWLPLMGGSAVLGGIVTWLRQRFKKPQDSMPGAV